MSVKRMRVVTIFCLIIAILFIVVMFTTELEKGYLMLGATAFLFVAGLTQFVYAVSKKNDK